MNHKKGNRRKQNKNRNKGKKKNRNKKLQILLFYFLTVLIIGGGVAGFLIYQKNLVYQICYAEAGVEVRVSDFLKKEDEKAYFAEDSDKIDIAVPGEYHLKVKTGFFVHDCTLYIQDTVAPVVSVKPVKLETGNTCEAIDFIENIEDVTKTTVSFQKEPDYAIEDTQKIMIAVTDAGQNTTVVESELTVYKIATSLSVEVGSSAPDASEFASDASGVKIITDMRNIDFSKLGSYPVDVEVDGKNYSVQMNIVDTEPPVFEVRDITDFALIRKEVGEFVTGVWDATEVAYSFAEEPDFSFIGTQTLTIIATDEGGNQSRQEAKLTLIEDKEPPRIIGASDIKLYLGEWVSYKANVRAEDNCQEGLDFSVDSSAVNLKAPGTYPVVYTATDLAGNSSSVTISVTVRERVYSEDEVNSLADEVLARIIKDNMSQYDKALAIFNYIKSHIAYIENSEKDNWVKAAYEGLTSKRGDCYIYACTAKALLTRAGILNMDIERIPSGTTLHYWNLVDIGDGHGWYHFDVTPRWNHPTIFLWTESQLIEYSSRNNNSHNYDHSLYPEVK